MLGKVGKGGNTKPTNPKPPTANINLGGANPSSSSPRFNLLVRKDVGDLTMQCTPQRRKNRKVQKEGASRNP